MRVKIAGEISPEQLSVALAEALKHFNAAIPGSRIFGANLYLQASGPDGQPFDLAGRDGKSLTLRIPEPAGSLAKPALTGEAAAKMEAEKERVAAEMAKRRRADEEGQAQMSADAAKKRLVYREREARFHRATELTDLLLSLMRDEFVAEMNAVVSGVWRELKPTRSTGKSAGEAFELPYFSNRLGRLYLHCSSWASPRSSRNPVFTGYARGNLTRAWRHEAWIAAGDKMTVRMEQLAARAREPRDSDADSRTA